MRNRFKPSAGATTPLLVGPDEVVDEIEESVVTMARNDGPSKTSDITARLGETMGQASVYRTHLLAAGVIRPAGYGRVDFALPFLREYPRDHAVHEEMTSRVVDE